MFYCCWCNDLQSKDEIKDEVTESESTSHGKISHRVRPGSKCSIFHTFRFIVDFYGWFLVAFCDFHDHSHFFMISKISINRFLRAMVHHFNAMLMPNVIVGLYWHGVVVDVLSTQYPHFLLLSINSQMSALQGEVSKTEQVELKSSKSFSLGWLRNRYLLIYLVFK